MCPYDYYTIMRECRDPISLRLQMVIQAEKNGIKLKLPENSFQISFCAVSGNYSPIIDIDGMVSFCSGQENVRIGNITNPDITSIWDKIRKKTVNKPPIAKASASETFGFVGEIINFDGSFSFDSDGVISNYIWSFNDGTTGNGKTTTHSYSSSGTYHVTLTVTDNDGAIDKDIIDIVISTDCMSWCSYRCTKKIFTCFDTH